MGGGMGVAPAGVRAGAQAPMIWAKPGRFWKRPGTAEPQAGGRERQAAAGVARIRDGTAFGGEAVGDACHDAGAVPEAVEEDGGAFGGGEVCGGFGEAEAGGFGA
jgi:hypothetical protein